MSVDEFYVLMAGRRQIDDRFLGDAREMRCLKLAKPLLATGVFWHKIHPKAYAVYIYTWNPNHPAVLNGVEVSFWRVQTPK